MPQRAVCCLAGYKHSSKQNAGKPLEGRTIYLDLIGRSNYVSFEKKLKLLGAVCTPTYSVAVVVPCGHSEDNLPICWLVEWVIPPFLNPDHTFGHFLLGQFVTLYKIATL